MESVDGGRSTPLRLVVEYVLCGVLVAALYHAGVLYPLDVFATFVHEACHFLVALLTGASVKELVVSRDCSGHVLAHGGDFFLVGCAGYLGAALFSALTLYASSSETRTRRLLKGVLIIVLVLGGRCTLHLEVLFSIIAVGIVAAFLLLSDRGDLQTWVVRIAAFRLVPESVTSISGLAWRTRFAQARDVWEPVTSHPADGTAYSDATLLAFYFGHSEGYWVTWWLTLTAAFMVVAVALTIRAELRTAGE